MTNEYLAFLMEALILAKQAAAEDEVPVGAVVIHEGKVIARGYNRREQLQNPIAHAEILAIQEAALKIESWRLNECTLVVTLEPCPMCLAACQQARVKEVFYGITDPKGGAISLGYTLHQNLKTNHRFPVTCLNDLKCGEILTEFFSKKRKK